MKQITGSVIHAFNNNYHFKSGNNQVTIEGSITKMLLHGNVIATKENGKLTINTCGWLTNTTKERLNAISNVKIIVVKGKWFLNGSQWNGELIQVV